MSIRELYEWYDYYNEEPFLADRLEIQLATLSLMVSGFGKSKSKHSDFMIRNIEKKELSQKDLENQIKAMFMPFAKKT